MPFSFTLTAASKTSAGVFTPSGVLVRTLWSGVDYAAGTHAGDWDEIDDTGHAAADGTYEIRILTSQTTYTWEGVVGNTSNKFAVSSSTEPFDGWHFMSTIRSMVVAGSSAYVATGYSEGSSSQARFSPDDSGSVTRILDTKTPAQFFKVASDGTNVYWAGNDAVAPDKGFIVATPVCVDPQPCDDLQVSFPTYGQGYKIYTSAIDLETDPGAVPTGLAVQKNGLYLFVSRAGMNSLNVIDKSTGQVLHALLFTEPGDLAISLDDDYLWMIHTVSGERVVQRFAIQSDGTLTPAGDPITGLAKPLALASYGPFVLVADGGPSQQIKSFLPSGEPGWTMGQAGGYSLDPTVSDDRFDFEPDLRYWGGPYIAAQGTSFWVGDPGCARSLHFNYLHQVLDRIAYVPTNYSVAADPNNPTRVFASYLEFQVNYDLPLGARNDSWTLVKNWRPGAAGYDDEFIRMQYTTTLSNGRTYTALLGEIFELPNQPWDPCAVQTPPTGCPGLPLSRRLRDTRASIARRNSETRPFQIAGLFPDGKVRWADVDQSTGIETWYEEITGFDSNNNPVWSAPSPIASTHIGDLDPQDPLGSHFNFNATRTGLETSGNVLVAFDLSSEQQGWHLGGVRRGASSWLWRASPSTASTYDGGDWPSDGSFLDSQHSGPNAGGAIMTVDHHILYHYRGSADYNMYRHYYDDGLLVNEFGNQEPAFEGQPGVAVNIANQWAVKLSDGRVYLYSGDESGHGGVHRWRIDGLASVAEQSLPVSLHKDVHAGLLAEYFDTPDLNSLTRVTTRIDGQVDFDWGNSTPPGTSLTDNHNQTFSARWSGFLVPTTTETYTFTIDADDSAAVWVDGAQVAASGTPGTIMLAAGVSYPIRVEYKQATDTANVHLKWSWGSVVDQVIPKTQLYTIPNGAYLMAGMPESGTLTDGTAGWNRSPDEDNTDYFHQWHVGIQQNAGNPYFQVWSRETAPGTYTVTRDLGTASSDTASWQVDMSVSYAGTYPNHDPYCGQRLELLDDAGKTLSTFYLTMLAYPDDGRIYANGKYIAQDTVWGMTYATYPWLPLSISAADGQITFRYGSWAPVTAAQVDPTADWRRLKTLRLAAYTVASWCGYDTYVNIDGLRVSRTGAATPTDLLAGVPAATKSVAGHLPWLEAGNYGWSVTIDGLDQVNQWSMSTNSKLWDPKGPIDLGATFQTNTGGTAASLSRDLGTPSDATASWTLAGQVSFAGNFINQTGNGGQYLDILDDEGKVIARVHSQLVAGPHEGILYANGIPLVATDTYGELQAKIMPQWQPFQISGSSNGQVTFQYGDVTKYPPVTTGLFESANWQHPKTMRVSFYTEAQPYSPRTVDFADLSYKTDPTYAGPVLWLKADDLTGANGDAVAVWPDKSGRHKDARQSNASLQPILHTGSNGMNGLNVVTFDGVDDYLQTAFDTGTSGLTVFYVIRTGSTVPAYETVLGSGAESGTSGIWWGLGVGTGASGYGAGWGGRTGEVRLGSVSGGTLANHAYFARYRANGTTWSMDGVNTTTPADTSLPKGLFTAVIGGDTPSTYPFKGDIAEIRVYNSALSDSECASIKNEMKTKWGLA